MARQPKFEGEPVVEVRSRLAGRVGEARLDQPLPPGTKVVIVVTGFVKGVEHVQHDKGVIRVQKIAVGDGYFVDDQVDADDLLHKLKAERKRGLDELLGTPPLFDGDKVDDDTAAGEE